MEATLRPDLSQDCREALALLYRIHRSHGYRRSAFIEEALSGADVTGPPSFDDLRNDREAYATLFGAGGSPDVESVYRAAIARLRTVPFEEAEDLIAGLYFMRRLISTAYFRWDHAIVPDLADFARDYERLDLAEERRRLHAEAVGGVR